MTSPPTGSGNHARQKLVLCAWLQLPWSPMCLGFEATLQRKIVYANVWTDDDTLTCLVAADPNDHEINQVINDKALANVFEAWEWTRTAMVQAGPVASLLMLNGNTDAYDRAERAGLLYRGGYLEIARRFGVRPFSQPGHPATN